MKHSPPWWLLGLAALALAAFPLIGQVFYVELLAKVMILAIFAMSLQLLAGVAGLVSLGHAAWFGVAAYTLVLMAPKYDPANLWITLPAAVLPPPSPRSWSACSCCAPAASTSSW